MKIPVGRPVLYRQNNLRTKPCEWCGALFRACRHYGIEARFHTRACFFAAKRKHGVIRKAA